jgi:hypothetical protein
LPNSANILLTVALLVCPCLCVGEQVAKGTCPHFDCHESCHAVPEPAATDGDSACDDCVHAVQSTPVERPGDDSGHSSQCVCQGALVAAELRLPTANLSLDDSTADSAADAADLAAGIGCRTAADAARLPTSSGRELCVRGCALLI